MVCTSRRSRIACFGVFFLIAALFGPFLQTCAQDSVKGGSRPSTKQLANANLTYRVIAAEGGGYGYDVFANEKRLIHQPTIPGQPGTLGFKKRSDAEKVAKLVIRKLKNSEIPPAITEEELRKLKVID